MSEDERELDLPTDDEMDLSAPMNTTSLQSSLSSTRSSSPTGVRRTQSYAGCRRAHHNALERSRRKHIKDSFLVLRDTIPEIKGEKISRARILGAATDYIQRKKDSISLLEETLAKIHESNESLAGVLRDIEDPEKIINESTSRNYQNIADKAISDADALIGKLHFQNPNALANINTTDFPEFPFPPPPPPLPPLTNKPPSSSLQNSQHSKSNPNAVKQKNSNPPTKPSSVIKTDIQELIETSQSPNDDFVPSMTDPSSVYYSKQT